MWHIQCGPDGLALRYKQTFGWCHFLFSFVNSLLMLDFKFIQQSVVSNQSNIYVVLLVLRIFRLPDLNESNKWFSTINESIGRIFYILVMCQP